MEKKKFYLLYNNKNQDILRASAESEEQIIEESQYYAEGVWFVYDQIGENQILNERIYRKKIKFPETPLEREPYVTTGDTFSWIN